MDEETLSRARMAAYLTLIGLENYDERHAPYHDAKKIADAVIEALGANDTEYGVLDTRTEDVEGPMSKELAQWFIGQYHRRKIMKRVAGVMPGPWTEA